MGIDDDDSHAARSLDKALQEFIGGHRDSPLSPAELHTVALQHRIAILDHDKLRAQAAKKSYDAALAAYSAEKEGLAGMRLLCLVDSAVLCAEMLGDAKEAKQRLDEVLAISDLPFLFHVSALVERGDIAVASATNSSEYEDLRFTSAKKVLARAARQD